MKFSVYRKSDGKIASHLEVETQISADLNTPEGHALIAGHYQQDLYKIIDGNPIEFKPDAPDADHEWHDGLKRWMLKPEVFAIREQRISTVNRIQELENSQHRALREAAFGSEDARRRLADIDSQIAELRKSL